MSHSTDDEVLGEWQERDLSEAARLGQLPKAFHVEPLLGQIGDVLTSGRFPILCGESGVGKTAAIYELVRRLEAGQGPPELAGQRIVQISLEKRVAQAAESYQVRTEFNELVAWLTRPECEVVVFLRDVGLALAYHLGFQLHALGYGLKVPMLAEGHLNDVEVLFDNQPQLEEYFVLLRVDQPSVTQTATILDAWAEDQRLAMGKTYTPAAREEALQLTNRFVSRGRQPRKAIDLLRQTGSITDKAEITETDIIDRFCRNFDTPRFLIDPSVPLDLAETESLFAQRVLGQEEAVRAVVEMIGLMKAGLSDTRRPFGVFLFVGPTGVGKTHLAQLLAQYLFGSRDRLIRFNMADFPQEYDAEVLFGQPDESRLRQQRGLLTQRLTGQPFSVLLLDEFEKAHQHIHDSFLQLFDEGAFINGRGELTSCRSSIIIATSNTGAEIYRGHSMGFLSPADLDAMDAEVDRRLLDRFRFEFLNRFDRIVHFHPLDREAIRAIALRELEALGRRPGLKRKEVALEVDESVLDWLAAHGYDPYNGARFLRRTIERSVATAIAESLVRRPPPRGSSVSLKVRRGRVVAEVPDRRAAEHERAPVVLPVGTTEKVQTLDRRGLVAEAKRLLATAQPRLEALEARREEASGLLDRMAAPGFWQHEAESQEVLARYRDLDVVIQGESRLAEPIRRLVDWSERDQRGATDLERLARLVESTAEALRRWEQRLAEEGPGSVWLVISRVDPLQPAGQWLHDLTQAELSWCHRLGLVAQVAAYELEAGEPTRVALQVEGPGAAALLEMEHGVHRLHRSQERDLRARVEVIAVGSGSAAAGQDGPKVSDVRRRRGHFGLTPRCRARESIGEMGLVVELLAEDAKLVVQLLADLGQVWQDGVGERKAARLYNDAGRGAVDPRTGATVTRLRDALRGQLDPLLEAWRERRREE